MRNASPDERDTDSSIFFVLLILLTVFLCWALSGVQEGARRERLLFDSITDRDPVEY